MPIYEFRCPHCTQIAAFNLKMSDPYPTDCPSCHQPGLSKIISQTSFVLKGGGWYSDAYSSTKKNDTSKATGTDGKVSSSSGSDSTTTSSGSSSSSSDGGSSGNSGSGSSGSGSSSSSSGGSGSSS